MSSPRNTIAPANSSVWNTSRVLNREFSDSRTVFTERNLVAARELAIVRTAEPETVDPELVEPRIIGGPETIAGGLFIFGFLGFLGGFGCAHKTSGPMTRAFGRRPVCGTRLGETFFFVETLGIMFDYTGKEKAGGNPPAWFGPKARRKIRYSRMSTIASTASCAV